MSSIHNRQTTRPGFAGGARLRLTTLVRAAIMCALTLVVLAPLTIRVGLADRPSADVTLFGGGLLEAYPYWLTSKNQEELMTFNKGRSVWKEGNRFDA